MQKSAAKSQKKAPVAAPKATKPKKAAKAAAPEPTQKVTKPKVAKVDAPALGATPEVKVKAPKVKAVKVDETAVPEAPVKASKKKVVAEVADVKAEVKVTKKKTAEAVVPKKAEEAAVEVNVPKKAKKVEEASVEVNVPKKAKKDETKAAKTKVASVAGDKKTEEKITRLHSVENMIKTPYTKPSAIIKGATVTVDTTTSFTNDIDTAHVVFVSKDSFGDELSKKKNGEESEDAEEQGSDVEDDKKTTKTTTTSKKSLDIAKLKTTYPLLAWENSTFALKAQGFSAGVGNIAALANKNGTPVFIVGVGKVDKKTNTISPSSYRKAISIATKAVRKIQSDKVEVQLPDFAVAQRESIPTGYGNGVQGLKQQEHQVMTNDDKVLQGIRQVITSNYSFDAYLKPATVKSAKHAKISKITLVTPKDHKLNQSNVHTAIHRAESENFAKEILSLRSNTATSIYMKEQCEALVKAHPDVLKIKVMDKEALEKAGHSLILSVNNGSALPPYIVGIEYTPPTLASTAVTTAPKKAKKDEKGNDDGSFVYIGKTLTFDTGGYSLKPPSSMLGMNHDKGGGSNTLALMRTLALTRPATKNKIVGVLTITDNQIGPMATHPGDAFQTPQGSVSIDNTDAEGRLALADAITFAQNHYNPKRITTSATLTGAIMIALGHNTGVFSNHKRVAHEILNAADNNGETMWNMPILKENHAQMEANETDLANVATGRNMGSSTAAAFLEKFVKPKISFVHLDIAGSATAKDNSATGATVATLQDIMSKH